MEDAYLIAKLFQMWIYQRECQSSGLFCSKEHKVFSMSYKKVNTFNLGGEMQSNPLTLLLEKFRA